MFVISPWYDIFCRLRSSFRTPRLNYPVFLNFPEFGNDRKCILWISRFLPRHRRHRHSSTSSLYNIYQWLMTLHSLFLPRYPALSCQILRKCKLHFKNISMNFWSEKTICQSTDKCCPHDDHISSHHARPQILVITINIQASAEHSHVCMKNGNASVLHLLGGMYESRAQLQQHNILFAKFLKLLWKSSHREKLAAGAAPVVLFKFEHFLGTSLPLHIAGYFFPRKMSGKFSHLLLIVSSTK